MHIFDQRQPDGSRHFARLPRSTSLLALREQLRRLPGLEITRFEEVEPRRSELAFSLGGHDFHVRCDEAHYHFAVGEPTCPDAILSVVATHCRRLLGNEEGTLPGGEDSRSGELPPGAPPPGAQLSGDA